MRAGATAMPTRPAAQTRQGAGPAAHWKRGCAVLMACTAVPVASTVGPRAPSVFERRSFGGITSGSCYERDRCSPFSSRHSAPAVRMLPGGVHHSSLLSCGFPHTGSSQPLPLLVPHHGHSTSWPQGQSGLFPSALHLSPQGYWGAAQSQRQAFALSFSMALVI